MLIEVDQSRPKSERGPSLTIVMMASARFAVWTLFPAVVWSLVIPRGPGGIGLPERKLSIDNIARPHVARTSLLRRRTLIKLHDRNSSSDDFELSSGLASVLPVFALFAAAAFASASVPPDIFQKAGTAIDTARNINLQDTLLELCSQVEELGPMGKVYFSIVYIALEVLALPAIPLTASAGYLFGAGAGTVVVLFSATIAAGVSFIIGRTFLRQYIESLFEDNKTFNAVDAAVAKEGFKVVFLLRLSPLLPFALSNYLYGLTSVDFWPYLLATLLGFAPGTFAYVYAGEAAKALSLSGDLPGNETLPWYAYAAALVFLAALTQVIGQIASDAVARIEEDTV